MKCTIALSGCMSRPSTHQGCATSMPAVQVPCVGPALEVWLCRQPAQDWITDQSSTSGMNHLLPCAWAALLWRPTSVTPNQQQHQPSRRQPGPWGHWPWRWAWARHHSDGLNASHVANPDRNNSNFEHQNGRLWGEPKGVSLGKMPLI